MSVPMVPPAPVRLSTSTVCMNPSVIFWAMVRASMSLGPPGASGTIRRTSFTG